MSFSFSKIGRTSQEVGLEFRKNGLKVLVMVEDLNWNASSSKLLPVTKNHFPSGEPDNFCKTFYNSLNLLEIPVVEVQSVLDLELDSKPRISTFNSGASGETIILNSESFSFAFNLDQNLATHGNFAQIIDNDFYMRSGYSVDSLGT